MKAGQHLAIGTHRAYLPCFTSPSALSLLAGVTPLAKGIIGAVRIFMSTIYALVLLIT